ncbi:MAG: DUF2520 domain-containing protein [Bacillota bacterium]|nr:DUF2520 domain-containing protein [Bacillota bacterium]
MERVGFIGAGAVGSALARALSRRGYQVVAVASASGLSARRLASHLPNCLPVETGQAVAQAAETVFLTVPDRIIPQVAAEVHWSPAHQVIHCSGATPLEALDPAARQGARTGVFHPLNSFSTSDPEAGCRWVRESFFAVESHDRAFLAELKALAHALGQGAIEIPGKWRPLYHATAVLVSNYLVALAATAAGLWSEFGVERTTALSALLPLIRGTCRNLEVYGLPAALTGPIARGDAETVASHLSALADYPSVLELYTALGVAALPLAQEKGGLTEKAAASLRKLFAEKRTPGKGGAAEWDA